VFYFALLALSQIDKKPIMIQKSEPVMQSLTEGIKFVFNNKTVSYYSDMVAVLLVEL
jgi:phosphotransferase system IIB component